MDNKEIVHILFLTCTYVTLLLFLFGDFVVKYGVKKYIELWEKGSNDSIMTKKWYFILCFIIDIILMSIICSSNSIWTAYITLAIYVVFRSILQSLVKYRVYVDFCIITILLIIKIGVENYNNTILFYSKMENPNFSHDTTLWAYLTPYIAACVGWVTFWAFWAQLKANELASDDAKRTGIQNTFNSMMETYNRNLSNLRFKDKNGLDAIDEYVRIINKLAKIGNNIEEDFCLVYSYFYFVRTHQDVRFLLDDFFKDSKMTYFNQFNHTIDMERSNHSALSTYYFQLYRIVKYVVKDSGLKEPEMEIYLGMLRSQMSPNEQLLLFYNWLAGDQMNRNNSGPKNQFGYSWEDENKGNKFFSEHKVIKHLNTLDLKDDLIKYCRVKNFIS